MAACTIARSNIWSTTPVNLPFILALFVVLILCTYVPAVSLTLVELFYGPGR
jgi:C4-dicarboxylate transporter, DctM subunit